MEFDIFMASHQAPSRHRQAARALAAASVFLGVLAGCVSTQRSATVSPRDLTPDVSVQSDRALGYGATKIGVLLPLTGPHANVGQQLWDAAVLSLFESGRDDINLVPHDTQGTVIGAIRAAESAAADRSAAVIGPLFSSSVSAARPVLTTSGIRGIALSNNSAEARSPFFVIGNHPETQVDALAAYLDSVGRRRVKLFGPDTRYLNLVHERLALLDKAGKIQLVDTRLYRTSASYTDISKDVQAISLYSQRVKALKDFTAIFSEAWKTVEDPDDAMQTALEKLTRRMERARLHYAGLTPEAAPEPTTWAVTEAEYSEALSDFLHIYHRHLKAKGTPQKAMEEAVAEFELRETLGKADFDAVLLPIGDKPLLVIAPMFDYFNISQPDVWLLGTDIWESTARQAPKDLQGSRYVIASSPGWADFKTRYSEAFGRQPERLATAAYDAVTVAIAEKKVTGHTTFDAAFLTRQQGFEGINGNFRFLPGGTNERALRIVELKKAGPAPVFAWEPEQKLSEQQLILPSESDKITPLSPASPPGQPTPPLSSLSSPETGKNQDAAG